MAADSVIVVDEKPLRLDLACGQHPKDGFTGVDLFTGDQRVDLLSFPWPWADGSVAEARCSHFIEHIPMGYIDDSGAVHALAGPGRRDLFLRFFDELWRVMRVGAVVEIVVPYVQSRRAFQDPTHRRFICEETFSYLDARWRKANGLEHYCGGQTHFVGTKCVKITDPIEGARHHEVMADRAQSRWGVVSDIVVELRKEVAP